MARTSRCARWPLAGGAILAALLVALAARAIPLAAQQPVPLIREPVEQLPALRGQAALDAGPARLEDFEQTAMQNHPQLAAAAYAVEVAEGKAWQARLAPNPKISAGSPQLGGDESQYTVSGEQEIFTHKRRRLDQAAACQEVEQARHALTRARFEVLTGVRRRFYETLAAQNRVAVLEDMVTLARKSKELGDAVFLGGRSPKTDVLQFEIELANAESALASAAATLEALRRRLAVAAGTPGAPVGELYGDLAAESLSLEFDQAQEDASYLNAQSFIAEAEAERARILLDRAIIEPWPTINLMGGYMRQLEGIRDMGMFGVTMEVPLWDRNQGGIHAAEFNISRADAEVRRVRVELAGQAAEALGRYRAALARVLKYQAVILPKLREAVEISQRLFQQEEIDFLRVLQSQKTLSDVNLGYIEAQAARWDAATDLANLLQLEQFP